jgi:hypothetical protein
MVGIPFLYVYFFYRPIYAKVGIPFLHVYFYNRVSIHCKKRFAIFPSPAGMSLTTLYLDGNNEIIPVQREFGMSLTTLYLDGNNEIIPV